MNPNTSLFLSVNDFALGHPYGCMIRSSCSPATGWWSLPDCSLRAGGSPTGRSTGSGRPLRCGHRRVPARGGGQPADRGTNARSQGEDDTLTPALLFLATPPTDPAFPSDHATMAGAVTAGLFLVNRKLRPVAGLAAALMAVSRVYIATHYPLDVAAGLSLGAAVSLAGWVLLRWVLIRVVELGCRPPG